MSRARHRFRCAVAVATSVALAAVQPAHADCPKDAALHIAAIRTELNEQAAYSKTWSTAWTAGLFATVVLQGELTQVPHTDPGTQADLWVGAAASLVGGLYMLLMPPEVVGDAEKFEEISTTAGADKCQVLAEGQKLLVSAAADEASGRGWLVQVFNAVLNTAVLLVLGLGFHRWTSGLVGGLGGEITAEATIFTQPIGLPGFVANARAKGWMPPAGGAAKQAKAAAAPVVPVLSFTVHF